MHNNPNGPKQAVGTDEQWKSERVEDCGLRWLFFVVRC